MVFSSHVFMFYFLPLALGLYYLMPGRARHLILTMLSYFFYGWANPLFVVLMMTSTVIDYFCGLFISKQFGKSWSQPVELVDANAARTRRQRIAVIVSVCSNLSLLGFFKYFNFATENYDAVVEALGLAGLQLDLAFRITLPLGISFYTFQSMSYTIDIYRGHARAIRNFIDFACYVSMFPQLVAGPIIRFSEVADQLQSRRHTIEKFSRGAAFISIGLAKKILLANPCGKIADVAFGAGALGVFDAWYGAVAYAFQIYFDFSAYSDIAIGLGLMLGFVFPKNFDSPYLAQSITEFWRRWHMSLSNWLRDYLYIPLGGNQKGTTRTYANLMIVMLLGGLWHGAAWTFIIWGGIHGTMLMLERAMGKNPIYINAPKYLRMGLTFAIVTVSWVFFRAPDLRSALQYTASMFGLGQAADGAGLIGGLVYRPYYVGSFVIAAVIVWSFPQTWDWTRKISWIKVPVIAGALVLALLMLTVQSFNPFIYFKF